MTATNNKSLTPLQQVSSMLEGALKPKIIASLDGTGISPERFIRSALTTLANNPYVVEKCDRTSLYAAIQDAAVLGLELNPALGQAAIVPRGGKAALQIQYKGLIQLATRSDAIAGVDVGVIYENDDVEYEDGTTPTLRVKRTLKKRGEAYAYYCVTHYRDGPSIPVVMTLDEITEHRDKYSDAWKRQGKKSPWGSEFDEMAKKTVLRRAAKMWPLEIPSLDADGSSVSEPTFEPEMRDVTPKATPRAASRLEALVQADSLQAAE